MLPCGGMYGVFCFCGFLLGCGLGWLSLRGGFGSVCVGSWWAKVRVIVFWGGFGHVVVRVWSCCSFI